MFHLPRALAMTGVLALAACAPQPGEQNRAIVQPTTQTPQATVEVQLAMILPDGESASPVPTATTPPTAAPSQGRVIGCDDTVVLVTCEVPDRGGSRIESALHALLEGDIDASSTLCRPIDGAVTQPTDTMAGVMNALATKALTLAGVELRSTAPVTQPDAAMQNQVTVRLTGTPTIAGVCEPPRLTAQIEDTVRANVEEDGTTDPTLPVVIELNGSAQNWTSLADGSGQ